MTCNKLISFFMFVMFSAALTSCGGDEDNGTVHTVMEYDTALEGSWKLENKIPGSKFDMPCISFRADGTGSSGSSAFRWYTSDSRLFMMFDDGSKLNEYYSIYGATLEIGGIGSYTADLPLTGAWYRCDAMRHFDGKTFCYFLNKNGDGIKYEFDYVGLTFKTFFKWKKSHEGISMIYRYETHEKACSLTDDTLNIEGEGRFTSALPFYGHWFAVDCERGLIEKGDDNYSELDIYAEGDTDRFVCSYLTAGADGPAEASYDGKVRFITSYQQSVDDQQLFILQDIAGNTDAAAADYRFFYYPQKNKVYLDLSSDLKTRKFVRYELE